MSPVSLLRRRHDCAVLVILGIAALSGTAGIPQAVQVAALGLAVLAGLPHGALDDQVARRRFGGRWGAAWPFPFLAGYLFFAGGMMLLWYLAPLAALSVFLCLSALHFGMADTDGERVHLASIVAHGAAPIVVPALAHPAEVARLFDVLVPASDATLLVGVLTGAAAIGWTASLAVTIARAVFGRHPPIGRLAELAIVIAAFVLLPPLIAFALYFAVLHAPRALLDDLPAADPQPMTTLRHRLRHAIPLTLAAVALGCAVIAFVPHGSFGAAAIRTSFWLLSALTVPHMWLKSGADHVAPLKC